MSIFFLENFIVLKVENLLEKKIVINLRNFLGKNLKRSEFQKWNYVIFETQNIPSVILISIQPLRSAEARYGAVLLMQVCWSGCRMNLC